MIGSSLKIAFIGAGNMTYEHIRAFNDIPAAKLVGIYSRTRSKSEKLASQFEIGEICDSIAELYEKTQAQLVVISVSELSVREICIEAFKYPWTCLIEKPVGYNLTDAEAIASVAHEQGRKAFVALNRRHYSSTRRVINELSELKGDRLIQVFDQEDPNAAVAAGRPKLVVKNWMYANSIHLIDYIRVFGRGEITSVEPIIRWNPHDPKFVAAKVCFSSGDVCLYQAVWNGPGPWAVAVTTQEKRWEMRPLEQAAFQTYGSHKLETVEAHEWDTKFKPGLRLQAEESVKAALGQAHNLPCLEKALESMRLVHAIYEE